MSKPLFKSVEQFKFALKIGSHWRKSVWDGGSWIPASGTNERTVCHFQESKVGFAPGFLAEVDARRNGNLYRANLMFLWFPRKGLWMSDEEGFVILYPDGTPNIRFDPVLG